MKTAEQIAQEMEKHKSIDGMYDETWEDYMRGKKMTNGEKIQPTTKNDLGVDAVSRKKVYYMITNGKYPNEDYEQFIDRLANELEELPSVTPIRPKGHWIKTELPSRDAYECSECGNSALVDECGNGQLTDFCPCCGVDMREVEE